MIGSLVSPSLVDQSVSVVVPVYRNEATVRELVSRITAVLETYAPQFEIILVCDGSPDDSWAVIEECAARDPRVRGVLLSRNFGQHRAISAGFDRVRYGTTVLMDGDLQDSPESIPLLVDEVRRGSDLVLTQYGANMKQRVTSRIYARLIGRLFSTRLPARIGTFRAFSDRFRQAMQQHHERHIMYAALMASLGFKTSIVPVERSDRSEGRSSYTFRTRIKLAFDGVISNSDAPHRAMVAIGAAISVLSFLYLLIVLGQSFIGGSELQGGVTLAIAISLASLGLVLASLGIIGAYVFRVYQEVLARPRYLIMEETEKDGT